MFTEYETKINNLVDKIKSAQSKFKTDNGKYFQSLKTGNKTVEVIPEMAKKALDEKKEVPVITVTDKMPFEIEIHEYQAPNNEFGYQIVLKANKDGKDYYYCKGYGIFAELLTRDWYEFLPISNETLYGTNR